MWGAEGVADGALVAAINMLPKHFCRRYGVLVHSYWCVRLVTWMMSSEKDDVPSKAGRARRGVSRFRTESCVVTGSFSTCLTICDGKARVESKSKR